MTLLGNKLKGAGAQPAPAAQSRIAAVLAFGPRGELVELPLIGKAWIAVGSHAMLSEVEAAVERRMAELGLTLTAFTAGAWESERAVQTLARCVRTAEDHDAPVGTPAEWAELDTNTINKCWTVYGDVFDRLAPLDGELPESTRKQIFAALVKKNATALRSFGVNALATFLLSMESPPATSPTPTSSDGESSPES